MYNPKSMKAEEFICHEEIMDTLAYADAHKDDLELVRQILDKAAERKGCGSSQVLLQCSRTGDHAHRSHPYPAGL